MAISLSSGADVTSQLAELSELYNTVKSAIHQLGVFTPRAETAGTKAITQELG